MDAANDSLTEETNDPWASFMRSSPNREQVIELLCKIPVSDLSSALGKTIIETYLLASRKLLTCEITDGDEELAFSILNPGSKLPFDLTHLLNIKPTPERPWTDYGYNMEFVGRNTFFRTVRHILEAMPTPGNTPEQNSEDRDGKRQKIDGVSAAANLLPPFPGTDAKTALSLVYSSVSGTGKTAAMLNLKKFIYHRTCSLHFSRK